MAAPRSAALSTIWKSDPNLGVQPGSGPRERAAAPTSHHDIPGVWLQPFSECIAQAQGKLIARSPPVSGGVSSCLRERRDPAHESGAFRRAAETVQGYRLRYRFWPAARQSSDLTPRLARTDMSPAYLSVQELHVYEDTAIVPSIKIWSWLFAIPRTLRGRRHAADNSVATGRPA